MNIDGIKTVFLLLLTGNMAFGQNDLAVEWTAHDTGDVVEANPFNGSFRVRNTGSVSFETGDTLWYGYFVNGDRYDLAFNPDLVSGEVLNEPFTPGDEIIVGNSFSWPTLWESGITVEFCAVVYGVGYETYTGELFTGDDDASNNTNCIHVVLPAYITGLNMAENKDNLSLRVADGHAFLTNYANEGASDVELSIYSPGGNRLFTKVMQVNSGTAVLKLPNWSGGVYIANIRKGNIIRSQKIVLH